jgi:hypothetical protein
MIGFERGGGCAERVSVVSEEKIDAVTRRDQRARHPILHGPC